MHPRLPRCLLNFWPQHPAGITAGFGTKTSLLVLLIFRMWAEVQIGHLQLEG